MLITSLYASNKYSQQIHVICGAQKQKKKKKKIQETIESSGACLADPKVLAPCQSIQHFSFSQCFSQRLKKKKKNYIYINKYEMTEKSECPFIKAHQCAQEVSYYYFWRCVGHWLNYKSFFGEGKTILNLILLLFIFTKWIFEITPSRFPQCPRNHFSNGTLLIHKVYFVDGIKRNATYAYPLYIYFFFYLRSRWKSKSQILY